MVAGAPSFVVVALTVIATLIIMLIQREFVSSLDGRRPERVARAIGITLIPLSMIFVTVIVARLSLIMR